MCCIRGLIPFKSVFIEQRLIAWLNIDTRKQEEVKPRFQGTAHTTETVACLFLRTDRRSDTGWSWALRNAHRMWGTSECSPSADTYAHSVRCHAAFVTVRVLKTQVSWCQSWQCFYDVKSQLLFCESAQTQHQSSFISVCFKYSLDTNGGDTRSRNLYQKLVQAKKLACMSVNLLQDFSGTSFLILHATEFSSTTGHKLSGTWLESCNVIGR